VSAPLVRMVVRVHASLGEDLRSLSERLFDETRIEYSYAAIVRGLLALGLEKLKGKTRLAVEFVGARVSRGRKAGARRSSVVDLDLSKDDDDLDLEFEDKHHDDIKRKVVVARGRIKTRLDPVHGPIHRRQAKKREEAAKVKAKLAEDEDEPDEEDIEDDDTLDDP
jgi:hypothetical protein